MSFLDDILTSTRARIAEAKSKLTEDALEQRIAGVAAALDLRTALLRERPSLIAEIKRATPSRGPLDLHLDATRLARSYEIGGAAAISVLTEPDYFKGSIEDLQAARVTALPVLRKDFILDPFQLLEARAAGADAVLLLVRILGRNLQPLVTATRALGMTPFVEVFHEDEVQSALEAGASVIGINHRDLESFEVDTRRTAKLAPLIPQDVVVVALSGVSTRQEVEELAAAGAHSVLVGESLVSAEDPVRKLRELRGES